MQDMNDSIEQLRKAVKTKAPKLDEQTILNGITKPTKSRNLGRRLTLSGMAVAGVVAIGLSVVLAKPTPLFSLASRSNVQAYQSASGDAASSKYSMGAMMPAVNYQYVPGDKLSWMGGSEKIYQVKPSGNPVQLLRDLADRFGIEGEIQQDPYSQGDNDHYFFGDKVKQYEAPSVDVYWQGTGSWWVNLNQISTKRPGFESDEHYKQMAMDVFGATGLTVTENELALYKDTGRRVVARLKVDGQETPIEWNMWWDEYGNLAYVSGNSVQLVDRGYAATVSEREAVNRISDWRYSGFTGGMMAYGAMANDLVRVEDPNPPLETKRVTVTKAKNDLVELWDKNGSIWLVPGYTFDMDGLWWHPTVFSLVDGLIELPDANVGIMY